MTDSNKSYPFSLWALAIIGAAATIAAVVVGCAYGYTNVHDNAADEGKKSRQEEVDVLSAELGAAMFFIRQHGEVPKGADRVVICQSARRGEYTWATAQTYGYTPTVCNAGAGFTAITFPVTYDSAGTPIIGMPTL